MDGLELLLLRHGIAEERRGGLDDGARSLTSEGRLRTETVLRRARALDLDVQILFSSPLTRARQTAEIAVAVGMAPSWQAAAALAPGGDASGWLAAYLESLPLPMGGRIGLVGHEPDLGLLAAQLLGARPGAIALRKAGLLLVTLDQLREPGGPWKGQLSLLLRPRILLAD
ncbi:MAG: histidine phosphatase family protein [Cyanobacteria bacterium]|nr:histidine phosphatase family protein [Cyanobacteriota bacterium]